MLGCARKAVLQVFSRRLTCSSGNEQKGLGGCATHRGQRRLHSCSRLAAPRLLHRGGCIIAYCWRRSAANTLPIAAQRHVISAAPDFWAAYQAQRARSAIDEQFHACSSLLHQCSAASTFAVDCCLTGHCMPCDVREESCSKSCIALKTSRFARQTVARPARLLT